MSELKGLYGLTILGRFGLGHRLVAWARTMIWCKETGAKMLSLNWYEIPIGPWIRKERDKRLYFLLFRRSYISGFRRFFLLLFSKKIDINDYLELSNEQKIFSKPVVVTFKNAISGDTNKYFSGFIKHHHFLKTELEKMTKQKYLPIPNLQPHMAVQVRLGDFAKVSVEKLKSGERNARIPIEWYVDMLEGLRGLLGVDIKAIVYSDGSDQDIQPLLALKNTVRAEKKPAITDILSMAQATLLIGAGSGMTLWAALLGQVPRICFTGQKYVSVLENPAFEMECGNRDEIPEKIINQITMAFSTQ